MNKKMKIEMIALIFLVPVAIAYLIYAFHHPKKTQTELTIDVFNGKMFGLK